MEGILPVVRGGQRQTVALTDSYMTLKARDALGAASPQGLDADRYTIERLRQRDAGELYRQPFGAVGAALGRGEPLPAAMRSGGAQVEKLTRTDLQLAQTHSARDWMAGEDRVKGYRRVLGGGRSCPLCVSAATRTYRKADLLPIHENCQCSVSPVYEDVPVVGAERKLPDSVRVRRDPELGLRLVEEGWS